LKGRPLQGDALYMRDICLDTSPVPKRFLVPEKLIKTALMFSLFGLPDCAAELLLHYEKTLAPFLDVSIFLDALTKQSISLQGEYLRGISGYKELMAIYDSDSPVFYNGGNPCNGIEYMAQRDAALKALQETQNALCETQENFRKANNSAANKIAKKLRQHRIIWFILRITFRVSLKIYRAIKKLKKC